MTSPMLEDTHVMLSFQQLHTVKQLYARMNNNASFLFLRMMIFVSMGKNHNRMVHSFALIAKDQEQRL